MTNVDLCEDEKQACDTLNVDAVKGESKSHYFG